MYRAIKAKNVKDLVEDVNREIADGWVPLGNPIEYPVEQIETARLNTPAHLYQFMTRGI